MRTVLVEWADAIGPITTGWQSLSEINRKPAPMKLVGFLVHEDDECVVLVAQIDVVPEPGQTERHVSHDMTVPKGCIKRMVDLVEAPSKSAGGRSGKPSRKGGGSRATGR